MKIKELNLVSFGAFSDKKITFKDGVNILVAENEWGKTTLIDAIDATLFSFLKSNYSKKTYTELYEKYKSGSYRVALKITYEDKDYLIERDLYHETCTVFDDEMRDVTNVIEINNKIIIPGKTFLKVNSEIYRRYYNIGTTEKEDEASLSFIEKTLNPRTLSRAISIAEKELTEIGSLKAPTKKRAKLKSSLDSLKEELASMNDLKLEVDKKRDEIKSLKDEIEKLEQKKEELLDTAFHIESNKNSEGVFSIVINFILKLGLSLILPVFYYLYGKSFSIFNRDIISGFLFLVSIIIVFSLMKNKSDKIESESNIYTEEKLDIYNALDIAKTNYNYKKGKLSILEEKLDEMVKLKDAILTKENDYNKLNEEYEITELALRAIKNVSKKAPSSSINEIKKNASYYYHYITGKDELMISDECRQYLSRDKSYGYDYFSSGTMEVVNFSIKLAFHNYFTKGDFLILDDAFLSVDDMRLRKIAKLIEGLSKDKQIIIATSNQRIVDFFDEKYIIKKEG